MNFESDLLVLSEQRSMGMKWLEDVWSGAKVEVLPSARRDIRSAPRAGVAVMNRIEPDVTTM